MKFKTDELRLQYPKIHPYLQKVISLADIFLISLTGKELVITDLLRPVNPNKPSYHPLGKAVDIRTNYLTPKQVGLLERFLFALKAFDPKLGVEPHEELKGTPQQHLHLQYKDGKPK